MPHSPARRAVRAPLALARAVLALAALGILVVGIPAALWKIGHLPGSLPSFDDAVNALSAPDDGSLLMTALTLAGWIAWLWLTVPLLVEIAAVIVRRGTPHLPGMGTGQRVAAFLVGSILLAAPTAASAATPAVAVSAPQQTDVATPTSTTAAADPDTNPAAPDTPSHERLHQVERDGAIAYDLAQDYLGDGLRWKELARLNPELPLTKASSEVPRGTQLRLPADARPAPAGAHHGQDRVDHETAAQATSDKPQERVAEDGDTLWGIAKDVYGDGTRYPELYKATKGQPQPGSLPTVNDPDLIYPGQHINLPADTSTDRPATDGGDGGQDPGSTPPPSADDDAPSPDERDADKPDAGAAKPSAPPTTASPKPETSKPEEAAPDEKTPSAPTPSATGSPAAKEPAQPSPGTKSPQESADAPESGAGQGQQAGVMGLAATGVLAAGFLTFLGVRRVKQLRRLRRGQAIALPDGQAASTEHALRVSEATMDSSVLVTALRTAAVHLAEAGAALPPLAAAVVGEREIVLHLTAPAPAVAPFDTEPGTLEWSCPTASPEFLDPEEADAVEDPYPALLSLGWDPAGRFVLVNLDHVGHLHLTGPARTAVQRALALELSTSEFAHHLDLSLAGSAVRELAAEIPDRLTAHDDLDQALPAVAAHHREQQQAFTVLGCEGLLSARTGADTAAAWTPHLVMADGLTDTDAEALAELVQIVEAQPRSATALITSGPLPLELPDTAWVLNTDPAAGPVRLPLPGTELDCELQAFSDEEWSSALEILERSRAEAVPEETYREWAAPLPPADSDAAVPAAGAWGGLPWEPKVVSTPTEAADDPGQVPSLAHFATYEDPEPGDDDQDLGEVRQLPPELMRTPREIAQDAAGLESEAGEGFDAAISLAKTPVPAQQSTPTLNVRLPEPESELAVQEPAGPVPAQPPVIGPGVTSAGPVIRVLGPVDVIGARGEVKESSRRRTNTELAAWLILHPGRDHQPLDSAMWPTKETQTEKHTKYRNVCVSRLRSWLGQDDTGRPFLPKLPPSADARYSLSPAVTSDWHQFLQLVDAASATSGPHATQALREALELVRGRPFMSDDRRRYRWAEHLAQVMLSKIVLTAEDLAQRCLDNRDPRGAVWAAAKGLDVAPEVESLYRILFQAYAALGDHDALERAAEALEDFNMRLGTETEDDTIAILNELLVKA
ncbi:LysM peptidoglycan-binding domain-containing protein [Streptomyces sp. NBC_01381]|uniref:LysM peptidoglycan-binding domain-containing protein n=1 Tax=Streptomyces sp. NBC_01381 TaxID=2903845 RepID=UPI002258C8E3|nr:LysM peptidoglycan-binding domain-containing protein [Streptomyces sp. NBC_01381]MCX4673640.1 LysM peptidoglycan-binding domain-containing protein [Streptomyces sp. NBC_01381]